MDLVGNHPRVDAHLVFGLPCQHFRCTPGCPCQEFRCTSSNEGHVHHVSMYPPCHPRDPIGTNALGMFLTMQSHFSMDCEAHDRLKTQIKPQYVD